MTFYKSILNENLDGVAQFIYRMLIHDGVVHYKNLYRVKKTKKGLAVKKGSSKLKRNNYALGTGGEVVNSFSPLYEIAYVFISLFLSGVGTAILQKKLLEKYRMTNTEILLDIIKTDLIRLTENEIVNGMKKPEIAIICNFDTDIIPVRYFKHQLWKIDNSVLTKRVSEITKEQYGKDPMPVINTEYWTKKDEQIANTALQSTSSLLHAKAIQYYSTLEIFLKELSINIKNIPIYFNFVPKEEIILNGSENSFLKTLIALHTPASRNIYRKIARIDKPWLITKACPKCGQGDKRILSSKLMSDGTTVKVHCRSREFFFQNESGEGVKIKGCGYTFSFKVPNTEKALYNFFEKEDFSIHFPVRELITILKDCSYNPLGLVVTDLGILRKEDGKMIRDKNQPKGYGDNIDMLISSIALQEFFINEKIVTTMVKKLKKQNAVISHPLLLFGYEKPTELIDNEVSIKNKSGNPTYVSDTSALKALEKGTSAQDVFKKSVHIHAFTPEELLSLKERSYEYINEKGSYLKQIVHLLEKSRLQTVIDLNYSLATYTKYIPSVYLNCAIIDKTINEQQLELIEKLYCNYQRKPAVYFENTNKNIKLKNLLKQHGYKRSIEELWMFYQNKHIDQTGFTQVKKINNLQELSTFLETFEKCYQKSPYWKGDGYLTILREAWMKNANDNNIACFIVFADDTPVAISILNSYKNTGFISNIGSLDESEVNDFSRLATLYAVWESQKKGNTITSLATENNKQLINFYNRMGFETEISAVAYAKEVNNF